MRGACCNTGNPVDASMHLPDSQVHSPAPSALALLPLGLFLLLFFGTGLWLSLAGVEMAFYQLRAPLAALIAIALGLLIAHRQRYNGLDVLLAGMGERNVMLMLLVFLLAGGFAELSRAIGAVDAVVALALSTMPAQWLVPGLFLAAALVSFAIGTSMGTLAATVPIGLGLAEVAGLDTVLITGALIGGAMFGDNLSLISDTTIAATRSQGAEMRDKLRANAWIALPAAALTALWLAVDASVVAQLPPAPELDPLKLLPYALVLALALAGLNVLGVLALGILGCAVLGVLDASPLSPLAAAGHLWKGMEGMTEIVLLALLIGGLGALLSASGGLSWLLQAIDRIARGRRGQRVGELNLAGLAFGADVLTANNTVAIVAIGPLAKQIARTHAIPPARAAGLIDVFACVAQGVLPYGAQILLAASLAGLSPLLLSGAVTYCWLLAALALLSVAWPRRQALSPAAAGS
jgi:Na+/H+ antiporter NhaC